MEGVLDRDIRLKEGNQRMIAVSQARVMIRQRGQYKPKESLSTQRLLPPAPATSSRQAPSNNRPAPALDEVAFKGPPPERFVVDGRVEIAGDEAAEKQGRWG